MKIKIGILVVSLIIISIGIYFWQNNKNSVLIQSMQKAYQSQIDYYKNNLPISSPPASLQSADLTFVSLLDNQQYEVRGINFNTNDKNYGKDSKLAAIVVLDKESKTPYLFDNFIYQDNTYHFNGLNLLKSEWIDSKSFYVRTVFSGPPAVIHIYSIANKSMWDFPQRSEPEVNNGQLSFYTETEQSKKKKPTEKFTKEGSPVTTVVEKITYKNGNIIYSGDFKGIYTQ